MDGKKITQHRLTIVNEEPRRVQEVKPVIVIHKEEPSHPLYTVKMADAPREQSERQVWHHPDYMTRQEFLEAWGYLQALKDMLEEKARTAAASNAATAQTVAGDYLKTCAEITTLQEKITKEADSRQ